MKHSIQLHQMKSCFLVLVFLLEEPGWGLSFQEGVLDSGRWQRIISTQLHVTLTDLWSKPAIHDKEPNFVFFPNKPITCNLRLDKSIVSEMFHLLKIWTTTLMPGPHALWHFSFTNNIFLINSSEILKHHYISILWVLCITWSGNWAAQGGSHTPGTHYSDFTETLFLSGFQL